MRAEDFYNQNFKSIYRFFYYYGVERSDCEDIAQEVFTRFFKGYMNLLSEVDAERPRKILWGIAKNTWKQYLAEQNLKRSMLVEADEQFEELSEIEITDLNSPEYDQKVSIDIDRIQKAMTKLSEKLQNIIQMRFIEGLTRKEVAIKLNISEDDVHTYQKRAIKYLREELSGQLSPLNN